MEGMRRRGIVATRALGLVDRRAACLLRRPLGRRFRRRQLPAAGQAEGDCGNGRNHKKIAQEHLPLMIPRIPGPGMCIWRVLLVLQWNGKKAWQSIENGNSGLFRRYTAAGAARGRGTRPARGHRHRALRYGNEISAYLRRLTRQICGVSAALTPPRQWPQQYGRWLVAHRCCRAGGCSPGSRMPPRARWPSTRSRKARLPHLMCRSWPTSCL